jgi:hypothetical protein
MKRPSAGKSELLRWLRMQDAADRRILAQLWSLPSASDPEALFAVLSDPHHVQQQWDRLSQTERAALARVLQEGGAVPVAIVQREWGPVREPARFSSPRAFLQALDTPSSAAERLFMMGLLVRDYDERGPVFRVLDELRTHLPRFAPRDRRLDVAPAAPPEDQIEASYADEVDRTVICLLELADSGDLVALDDGALNKASLVRFAKRFSPGADMRGVRREADWPWVALLRGAVTDAGLLQRTADGQLHLGLAATRWLQASRSQRTSMLLDGWAGGQGNDLTLLCGLTFRSQPFDLWLREARRGLLDLFRTLPADAWLPVDDVVHAVERVEPDFLRRNGRYDTWLVYDQRGRLLSGRDAWPMVEGQLVRAVLLAVLRWLGLVEAAGTTELHLIRLTELGAHLLRGAPEPAEAEPEPLSVQGTFEIVCPPGASPWSRFQLRRVAEPVKQDSAEIFKLTRRSILRAVERGIAADEIASFLTANGRGPLPQAVAAYIYLCCA